MISSPEQNVVYYPSGSDIYALYTKTREREVVTRLPFSPHCVTADQGWLCCGGQPGHFTAISIKGRDKDFDFTLNSDADPDARLPLDLDPTRRSTPRDIPSLSRSSGARQPLIANVRTIGEDINNCITLWFPKSPTSDRTYKIPVAVAANNDKTVSIIRLEDSEVLDKLTYPDCVNRAVISPDGELLIAILDDPFLYIHQRERQPGSNAGSNTTLSYEWKPACRIQLEGQKQSDQSTFKGSFAAAFSKSGKFLAVGTQHGVISVFDTESLLVEDSEPLAVFTTSRPMQASGAVRSMEFSPAPFDLLAWTEASGRAGVADLRDLFLSRQLLTVDCRLDGMVKIIVSERSGDETRLDPRLRSFRTDSSLSSTTPDYLGLDFERRQLRHLTREMLDRHQPPLTAEETEVLQAMTVSRRQRDVQAETSGTSASSPWANSQRVTTTSANASGTATSASNSGEGTSSDRRISTAGLPAALREFVNPDRTAVPLRSFINERNRENERRNQQQEPRRRASIILAAAEQALEQETLAASSAANRNGNDTSRNLERLSLTPPRLLGSDFPNNPWTEIDAPYHNPLDRSTRVRIELEDDDRGFAHRLRQPWRGLEERGLGSFDENLMLRGVLRTGPANTMGCCWSPDGRLL